MEPTRTLSPAGAELSPAKRELLQAILRGRAPAAADADAIPRRPAAPHAPLSFAQERLWFLERLGQGNAAYNILLALRVSGALDVPVLRRALLALAQRHDVLRTALREVDGVPVQSAVALDDVPLPVDDLSALQGAAREAEVGRRCADEEARPFHLGAAPLFRARLLGLDAGEHVLLFCIHHVVCDGWSMQLLVRDLWALYHAARDGAPPPPAPALRYADYAAWQRERAGGADEARGLAYWTSRLAGAPGVLELPADRPRPAVPSFRGGSIPVHVAADVLEGVRTLARAEGATLFMAVLAAFQALLARWAGTDDVVVGTPVAGRTRREVEEVVGLFMNTLALRTDLSGDPSFRALLRRVRQATLEAYDHQEVPFERVVAAVQPERTLRHATLFQVVFQLETSDGAPPAVPGLRISALRTDAEATKFDLSLLLHARGDEIEGVLEYAAELFEASTAARMVEQLGRVLAQAVADSDLPLSRLQLAGAEERARIAAWNRTAADYAAESCIHQLFEAQVQRTPDAAAIVFGGETLAYAEVDARANRLARRLVRLGVGPEVRVGVCMERAPELIVSLLAVMKAGGAWVPADPGHPAERIAYVMRDGGVRVLLTQARLRDRVPVDDGVSILCVDAEWDVIRAESSEPVESGVSAENLAYVIYTSGSTGRPKGVAMHHRGVVNYIEWGIRHYGAERGNGSPVFSSLAVDLTITNLLPLFAGRPVHLLPEENAVEALAEALRGNPGFGLIKITPIHLGLLNEMLPLDALSGAAHTLVVGADFLAAGPTLPWQDHAPGVRLMNEYGPTETVVGCSAYTLPAGVHREGAVPVGPPIQNLAFHVLDARMHVVPVGLPGELYIGGAGVARGYLGRPALTAEKFVPDPFADGAGARMYRTGDRARWLASGDLAVLGRTDHQVKLRGYRVELGEVEAVLRGRAGVRECVAVVREDRPGDRRLAAYVVGDGLDGEELRTSLRRSLPAYMVPDAIVVLPALPQTSTGKLDRATLPPPPARAAGMAGDTAATETEMQLLQLWEELLGVEGIGPDESFFALGGSSLPALRLFARVNRAFGVDLPVATLFAGATLRQMAAALDEALRAGSAAPSPVVALRAGGAHPPLFCVHPADRRVFGYLGLARHLGPEQPVYGLRDVGDDLSRPVPVIAAEHVAALRQAQPRGPYYLLGWSFGGFVAHEMAVRLRALGETVAFTGLMDAMSPELARAWPWDRDADEVVTLAMEAAARRGVPFSMRPDEVEGLGPDEQARRVVEALRGRGVVIPGFDAGVLAEQVRIVRARNHSRDAYTPGVLDAPLTLFRALDAPANQAEFLAPYTDEERRTLGWSRHASTPVEVRMVPGEHATVGAEPHVRALVRDHLVPALAAARAAHASSTGEA